MWFSIYECLQFAAISNIEFFYFSWTERVKKKLLKSEDDLKPIILVNQIFFQVILTRAECSFVFYLKSSSFAPCTPLGEWQYRPTFEQQYFKNGKMLFGFYIWGCIFTRCLCTGGILMGIYGISILNQNFIFKDGSVKIDMVVCLK